MRSSRAIAASFLLFSIVGSTVTAKEGGSAGKTKTVKCEMTFTLAGWSAFYKTAKGDGTVTCNNGQSAKVHITCRGGGLTFGKSRILDGRGVFSEVTDISEIFGSYAAAEAHAGAVKSAAAQAMTKGEVSLALSGTGEGVDLGFAFGKFTISRM